MTKLGTKSPAKFKFISLNNTFVYSTKIVFDWTYGSNIGISLNNLYCVVIVVIGFMATLNSVDIKTESL